MLLTDDGLARPAVDTGTAAVPGTNGTAAPGITGPAAAAAGGGGIGAPGIAGPGITATAPARPAPCFRFDGGIISGGSVTGTGLRSRAR